MEKNRQIMHKKNNETQSERLKKASKTRHFDIMQNRPSEDALSKLRKPSFYQTGGTDGRSEHK